MLLFQRTIPLYRDPVFRILYRELGIVLCHSPALGPHGKPVVDEQEQPGRVAIPGRFLRGRKGPSTQAVWSVLRTHGPKVVIAQFSFGVLTFWKLLALKPLLGYKLIPWSHGVRNDAWVGANRGGRAILSLLVYRLCDAALFYSEARRCRAFDRNPHLLRKSFVANNTLDTTAFQALWEETNKQDATALRQRLNLPSRFNILFIGRLLPGKRLDILIQAWRHLKTRHDVGLIVIGDGSQAELLKPYKEDPRLMVTGAIHDNSQSAPYLTMADICVIPGEVGLGIVHGYAFGLPMITCRTTENGPYHGPEIEYLKDGWNGFFCDSTPESIAACIEKLILDPELLASMKANALETVRTEANVKRMVEGFRQAIDFVTRDCTG